MKETVMTDYHLHRVGDAAAVRSWATGAPRNLRVACLHEMPRKPPIAEAPNILKWLIPRPYTACMLAGLLVGIGFGDLAFPSFETALGDPLADLLFGVFGGLFVGMVCETAGEIRAIFSRPS
jgi:hypothetical protein